MIVECYTADVYCECEDHPYGTPGYCGCPVVYTGRFRHETDRQRRNDGWIKVTGRDVCPTCKSKKPLRLVSDERTARIPANCIARVP